MRTRTCRWMMKRTSRLIFSFQRIFAKSPAKNPRSGSSRNPVCKAGPRLLVKASTPALVLAVSLSLPIGAILLAVPGVARAQKNVPQERILEGRVVNKDGDPIAGAVVYLQNSGSAEIKTYIADNAGNYRFGNLSRVDDYQLWAESNGVRSKSHGISSFDDSNKFYIVLKVNVSKPVSLDGPAVTGSTDLP